MDPLTIFHKRLQQYDECPFPDLRKNLSQNPNITLQMVLEDIKQNPTKRHEWEFHKLAEHIPLKDLLPYFPSTLTMYQYDSISIYGKIDIDTIVQNPSFPWNWCEVTWNQYITMDDIAAHPELPWDYETIIYSQNFKLHPVILKHENDKTFERLSRIATLEQLEQYPNKPWTYLCLLSPNIKDKNKLKELYHKYNDPGSNYTIAGNPNLNFQDLYELIGSHEDFYFYASHNPNITVQDFLTAPAAKWDIKHLSRILPVEFMVEHLEYKWNWTNVICFNKTLTYDKMTPEFYTCIHNFDKKDKDGYITYYDAVTNMTYTAAKVDKDNFYIRLNIIRTNRHVSWYDKKRIYEDLLRLNLAHVEFIRLISLPFFLEPTLEEMREHFAGKRIVRGVVEAVSNPVYEQCRKRLKREHEHLT